MILFKYFIRVFYKIILYSKILLLKRLSNTTFIGLKNKVWPKILTLLDGCFEPAIRRMLFKYKGKYDPVFVFHLLQITESYVAGMLIQRVI
jgi:hypothetical protein